MKWFLVMSLPAALTSLRMHIDNGKKDLFCFAFLMPQELELPRFQYFERQLKKCDGYGLYSVRDIPEHNVTKVLDIPEAFHAPGKFHNNYMNGVATWNEVVKEAANYRWFFNVHTDTFFRPAKVMAALQHAVKGLPVPGIVAVSRPGRHSSLEVTSCAVAMSSELLQKMIANPVVHPEQLAADYKGRAAEDRLLNVWIKSVDGIIINTINQDAQGCTAFSSPDRQDLPDEGDLQKMLAGESYIKVETNVKANVEVQSKEKICYSSDLAAIHPVKEGPAYEKLCGQLN
jgi:hypothetical protein